MPIACLTYQSIDFPDAVPHGRQAAVHPDGTVYVRFRKSLSRWSRWKPFTRIQVDAPPQRLMHGLSTLQINSTPFRAVVPTGRDAGQGPQHG